jgi:hypothetical protein
MPYLPAPDLWDLVVTFILSTISGAISIGRRIISGVNSTWLWIVTEYLSAILCGFLMYGAFPVISPYLPSGITLTVAVAFAAHSGGRIFQESEEVLIKYVERIIKGPSK